MSGSPPAAAEPAFGPSVVFRMVWFGFIFVRVTTMPPSWSGSRELGPSACRAEVRAGPTCRTDVITSAERRDDAVPGALPDDPASRDFRRVDCG